jgi:hypothetical protein
MALTTAEKQQRYRERHLGVHGTKERLQLFISVRAKAQLGRLARHHGYTVTMAIETLAAEAERALLDQLPERQQHTTYLDGKMPGKAVDVSVASKPAASRKRGYTPSRPRRRVTA